MNSGAKFLCNKLSVCKMQQDTNTLTQSVIDYFNISNFCMNKVRKFAMKFSYLRKSSKFLPPEVRF